MMSVPVAIGLPDVANRALADIKSRNELVRTKGTKALATFLEAEIREISGEKLSKLLGELNKRIGDLVSSVEVHEKLGGIEAIDTLLEIDCDEAMSQVFYFANHLRHMFPCADIQTMVMGSRALGHLAAKGGAVIADTIDFEIKRALEGLTGERQENRRLASVLVLKELAHNAPTLFNVYVAEFLDKIWTALRDPKEQVRSGAVDALRACLTLILERQSSMRLTWYYKIYDEAIKGLRQSSPENIHGSLLTIGELLRSTGEFLGTRFKEICDWVLKFKDHKDPLVRKTTISLIPILAGFNPKAFNLSHLQPCASYMLTVMKKEKGAERSAAFLAFGELSQHSEPSSFLQFVDQFAVHLKDAISRPSAADPLPFQSLQLLVRSLGTSVTGMARDLVDAILSTAITKPAVVCLAHMAESITELHPQISSKLLDAISMVLQKKPFAETNDKSLDNDRVGRAMTKGLKRTDSVGRSSDTLALALQTLGEFNFIGQPLLNFVCECVVTFLEDPNPAIRREAAASCSKLLLRPNSNDIASPSFFAPRRGLTSTVIAEVLEKLLVVGISDPEPSIRLTVLKALDSRYDYYLAQAQCIRSLFIAVNDENFEIREVVIQIIGRLTQRNPAYVMPTMRKMLIQLLTELEFGTESRQKEEAARLLRHLIHASQRLIKPYVQSILKVLHPRLRDSNSTVASCVLATLGELALVGAHEIRNYVDIFSLVIEALQDQGSVGKREVAVRTLVQLVQATGSSIEPYSKYPQLMGIIISGLQSEQSPPIRIELIRLLGTLGALDPMEYKQIQMQAKHRQTDVVKNQIFADEDEVAIVPSNEEYYPSVAISALIRILRDSTLATHHPSVSQAIMKIFQAMGIRCVQFLPKVMPPFLALINSAEFGLRDNLFMQLGHLVSVVKQHIRPYLDDIFSLIDGLWTVPTLHNQILSLVEEISSALKDEFKSCVPDLLPHMLHILNNRSERDTGARGSSSANMNAVKVLQVLRKFDSNLDDYLHLVVPSVVRLAELADNSPDLQKEAVKWLGDMCPCLNFSDFASRIIHPLTRILDAGTPEIKKEVMNTLTAVATELGSDFLVFRNLISSCISRNSLSTNVASQDIVSKYEAVVMRISRGMPVAETSTSSGSLSFIPAVEEPYAPETVKKIQINPHNLRKAWESSQRSTREDWTEWIRRFSVELLRESSSPALRSCAALAQVYTPLARELFNAAFVSCWSELADTFQQALVASVGLAFDTEKAPNVPPEVLQILLNLAEFMEHDEHPLPIDVRRLGEVAEKCQAFAKALHYKEHEFKSAPQATIGSLISINYQLNQPEAADGILVYAKNQQATEGIQEEWYEKLRQWDEALNAYESRLEKVGTVVEKDKVHAGIIRCLYNVGDWQSLHDKAINLGDRAVSREVAWMATMSAWHLNRWESMRHFSEMVDDKSIEGSYFRAVLAVHHNDFSLAESWIEKSRSILDTKLTALVGESYERAYDSVVRAMEICELEEVLTLKRLSPDLRQSHLDRLKLCWNARLYGCQASVDVWHRVLAARSVVIAPHTDLESWAKFCSLCIKSRKRLLASNTIISLMCASSGAAGKAFSPSSSSPSPVLEVLDALSGHADPRISYVSMKFLWNFDQKSEALKSMRSFVEDRSDGSPHLAGRLQARCHLRIGEWTRSSTDALQETSISAILKSYSAATEFDPSWGKAWHSWALMNYDVIQWLLDNHDRPESSVIKHAIPAIKGFFKSISLAQDAALQDILRLLTLWFKHGAQPEVEQVLIEGFNTVDITTWLEVIPQIIARINTPAAPIRKLINDVLCRVGHEHPQALIYPLTVAAKSQSVKRKAAADAVMGHMLQFSPNIVNQAVLVSQELIRVAILWHEIWHEALEEASRLFFSEKNIDGMFQVLEPVHAMMEKGAETVRETSFMQLFGRDLTDANECCLRYKAKKAKGMKEERDLSQAWDLYYHVYKNITKQLPQMTTLELQYVSPKLLEAHELDLCVPGTYKAGRDIVSISSFAPTLTVMVSKQRPRRCTIHGSDGTDYQFLLKGHEDLRQDERVMQLFGLVNTLLLNDRDCCRQELNIQRYSVIPLSPKSGLIEWVPNCDTLHALIKDYRDSKKALVTIEHRIILQMAPDFEHLPLIKKIEVFRHTLEQTTGLDLYKVLWLKSRNSEVWLQRRTNFTRSLAVMSMVGYILGLGDRHPSNLMLHKYTGKVLHIDFGDCFEVATKREKFPEKIPFRLTRMLTKAMEVSGIEGNFRFTCKNVMRVLREHRPSVMAMLEAFVYDPLINWRLLETTAVKAIPASIVEGTLIPGAVAGVVADAPPGLQGEDLSMQRPTHHRDEREIGKLIAIGEEGDGALSEVRNAKAVMITKRVQDKLTGRDFENEAEPLDIDSQVARLISEAISEANLSQCYIGWCPFW